MRRRGRPYKSENPCRRVRFPVVFGRAVLYRDGIASTLEAEDIMKRAVFLVAVLVALVGNLSSASAQCGTAQVIAPTCGAITWEGCCTGNVATWCDDEEAGGPLCGRDCGPADEVCSWSESVGAICSYSFTAPLDGHDLQCCDPQCEGKACGADNACGGVCAGPEATCEGGKVCAPDGVCCQDQCAGKACGPDGCGGTCGECGCGEACLEGACVFLMCKTAECGADGCGGSCGNCAAGQVCTPAGACCVPTCNGAECGDDGCGGTCGLCRCGERCVAGTCAFEACDGKKCGDDGCGGECGQCEANESCSEDQCVTGWFCTATWQGGDDGCDCECGAYDPDCDDPSASVYRCEDWQTCDANGHCVGECVPDCEGKQCGDDGCGKRCGTCAAGTTCNDDDQCAAGWVCEPYYLGDGYSCDCGCGAYDPDCDDPELWISGCESWQRCDANGACTPDACTPECAGKQCGPDGCGGTCGGCPLDALQCVDGVCLADSCKGIPSEGCCDGSTLRRCSYGTLTASDCAEYDDAAICGWDADAYYPGYACGADVDPVGDPSGELPLVCPACEPGCAGKECGAADGCGGTCGCPVGLTCQAGQCLYCAPMCYGKACGADGCGGSCGECADGGVCVAGQCCTPACEGKTCGADGCGGTCGSCTWPATCQDDQCCTPACDGVTCGNADGCGGTCGCASGSCVDGTCQGGCGEVTYEGCCDGSIVQWCSGGTLSEKDCATDEYAEGPLCGWDPEGGYYWCGTHEDVDPAGEFERECAGACTPDCAGKACDQDNGCGKPCGCAAGQSCEAGQCVACMPQCVGVVCGDDGCGGSCGACAEGETCHEYGVCVDACQGVLYEGCCEGATAKWCEDGVLNQIDCTGSEAGVCGWSASGYYDCVEGGADPSGSFPLDCPTGQDIPNCKGKECGPDGIGGQCGQCGVGLACKDGLCASVDTPDCTGRECGPDGMGGSCGACADGETCTAAGQCAPAVTPDVVDDATIDTVADVADDKTATDVPAPDAPAGDMIGADTGNIDRDGGGGGGCTVEARSSNAAPLVGLLALLGAALLVRRRTVR